MGGADEVEAKRAALTAWLKETGSLLVAWSGGVDSTYLAAEAHRALGERMLAVTATSPLYAGRELREAQRLAAELGIPHLIIDSDELAVPGFADNPPERCYLCKRGLFGELLAVAQARGLAMVADGANRDDRGDYRPGRRAAAELGIASPLDELGFTKADIRAASLALGLPTAGKAAFACLASRFPYGERIDADKLAQVEGLEDELAARGCGVDRATALTLADAERTPLAGLIAGAERIRRERRGNRVRRCLIVNARSGACGEDCAFCAQSRHHATAAEVFPLLPRAEILARAREALAAGVSCFGIVTSGRKPSAGELTELAATVRACRELGLPGIGLSVGILERDELALLQAAGVDHINHNLETSRRFYPEICSTHSWDERRATVAAALALGLRVCCGGIFGLGETWADRVDLALALRELGVDQVPLNFLSPVPGTPLGHRERLSAAEALRVIAVYRHLLPDATLGVCGGRPETLGERQDEIFMAGADGLMTGDYLTTAGIDVASDLAMIRAAGLHSELDGDGA